MANIELITRCYWKGKYYLVSPFSLEIQIERKISGFPKTFWEWYLFAFVECLCNRSSKMGTKNCKKYISILAIVKYRNRLHASPPVIAVYDLHTANVAYEWTLFIIFCCVHIYL